MNRYSKALNRDLAKEQRPFYILPDNGVSSFVIKQITMFSSITESEISFTDKVCLNNEEFLDNEYLRNKKESSVFCKKIL